MLHTLSTSGARYGRYIQPLLSLSIDFYVRIFIRVQSSPTEVKKISRYVFRYLNFIQLVDIHWNSKTAMYFICTGCQSHYEQPLGRIMEKVHEPSGNVNLLYKTQMGPLVSQKCPECDSPLHVRYSSPIFRFHFN